MYMIVLLTNRSKVFLVQIPTTVLQKSIPPKKVGSSKSKSRQK